MTAAIRRCHCGRPAASVPIRGVAKGWCSRSCYAKHYRAAAAEAASTGCDCGRGPRVKTSPVMEPTCLICADEDGANPEEYDVIQALRILGGHGRLDAIVDAMGNPGPSQHRRAYRGLASLRSRGRVEAFVSDGTPLPADSAVSHGVLGKVKAMGGGEYGHVVYVLRQLSRRAV